MLDFKDLFEDTIVDDVLKSENQAIAEKSLDGLSADRISISETIEVSPVVKESHTVILKQNDSIVNPESEGAVTADEALQYKYPYLYKYTTRIKRPERAIIGRENEMNYVLAAMERPELSNVILLGEAGSGKTALTQGISMQDTGRLYLEVDLPKMISDEGKDNLSNGLKQLFDESSRYGPDMHKDIVLFVDEFHRVVQESPAAVETLKPLLADSGTRGIRVIAATTFKEFREFIQPNQPLVERLQRISLNQPDRKTTIQILKNMADKYEVREGRFNDYLYELIYEYTQRYIPANSQPRKSIDLLDAMIGWHRRFGRKMDKSLLADVIYQTTGVNVAFRVDPTTIKQLIDARVFAQSFASKVIEERLQICVADLNNKAKPMASFLFTGSSGVGKALRDSEMIPVWDETGKIHAKRNGDLKPGDYVFNRKGEPVRVDGIYPQGKQDVYRVELKDGRILDCSGEHLWNYRPTGGDNKDWQTVNTLELMKTLQENESLNFVIPMNGAVQYPEKIYDTLPEHMGFLIGHGDAPQYVPEEYKYGSVEQRWHFITSFFYGGGKSDPDNSLCVRYNTDSEELMNEILSMLYSLGIYCETFVSETDDGKIKEYTVRAFLHGRMGSDIPDDVIGIRSVIKLDEKDDMTCIMVDDEEHLYQAGNYVVTHNTEMVKTLAGILFNDERRLIRFDMTEYANPDSLDHFRHELTNRIWERPYSIILLDEIEKSCGEVTRLLLQVLDDGRLIDENGREIPFTNAYIILTTNAASEIYDTIAQYDVDDEGSGENMAKYNKVIRAAIKAKGSGDKFPPELLGRIDCIVPFQPLSEETQKNIVSKKLKDLVDSVLQKHNVRLTLDERIVPYLVLDHLDTEASSGGARAAIAKLENEVTTAIARHINAYPDHNQVYVKIEGEMRNEYKGRLRSEAYVKVTGETKTRQDLKRKS